MKILKDGEVPDQAPWIGMKGTCNTCGCEFELEEKDEPRYIMDDLITIRCPVCFQITSFSPEIAIDLVKRAKIWQDLQREKKEKALKSIPPPGPLENIVRTPSTFPNLPPPGPSNLIVRTPFPMDLRPDPPLAPWRHRLLHRLGFKK